MKFDRLAVLLPHSDLEDFNLQRTEDDAEQLLSAWSALWHPALLAVARAVPTWLPAAEPPCDPSGFLITVPDCCEPLLPEGWLAEAEAAGACVLRKLRGRDEMIAEALRRFDDDRQGGSAEPCDSNLVADFLALGFCRFQVELLSRKARYASNVNETAFREAVVAAADATIRGHLDEAPRRLRAAFDRLHDAREAFFPGDAWLLDLTLVAPSTVGASLRQQLSEVFPWNLLVSGQTIETMARQEPATLDALKQSLQSNAVGLIGGEYIEAPLPLLEPEAIRGGLRHGLNAYQNHLGARPKMFGRRRFGLTPSLPSILRQLDFTGALHCTLDDGRFPLGTQNRIRWEGLDGTEIDALACVPIRANSAAAFLGFTTGLIAAMDISQSPTIVMAHWPGGACRWYDDLRRVAAYGSILGRFITTDDFLEQTAVFSRRTVFKPDQYCAPYLKQDATSNRRDPISRWVRYHARRAKLQAIEAVAMLSVACGCHDDSDTAAAIKQLADDIEDSLDSDACTATSLNERLDDRTAGLLAAFAHAIGSDVQGETGRLVVNPWSFSRQSHLTVPQSAVHPQQSTSVQGAMNATRIAEEEPAALDVPAMGFAWIGPVVEQQADSPQVARTGWFVRKKPKGEPPLAEEYLLRNEFFAVHFDPDSGAIQTISDYHSRDPRLAQQIAFRLPQVAGRALDDPLNYSIMAADEIAVTSPGPVVGELVCRGRLLDHEGQHLAVFRQTTRVWRGSRVLEIQIDLDITRPPEIHPWDSYYAVRFAWKDETAVLRRGVNLASQPTDLQQFESPHFVDIHSGRNHTTLLTTGLPYHRRIGPRKLDTLLVTHGETARSFRLGIGIDVPNPAAAALDFLAPAVMLANRGSPPNPSGWLFHLDRRNVLATHWEPLQEQETIVGFRVRLLETEGTRTALNLRCLRNVVSARKINPGDVPAVEQTVDGDRVTVTLGPYQWVELEVLFS